MIDNELSNSIGPTAKVVGPNCAIFEIPRENSPDLTAEVANRCMVDYMVAYPKVTGYKIYVTDNLVTIFVYGAVNV